MGGDLFRLIYESVEFQGWIDNNGIGIHCLPVVGNKVNTPFLCLFKEIGFLFFGSYINSAVPMVDDEWIFVFRWINRDRISGFGVLFDLFHICGN